MTNFLCPSSPPRPAAVFLALVLAVPSPAAPPPRELSTDRPDTTESARSVDAGHFQFELEIAAWEHDGGTRTLNPGELNLKWGLDDSTDLQLVLPASSRTRGGAEGFGDIELRLKRNLWGNDHSPTALALMPFVKIPTASDDLGNGKWEGGLIVPFAFPLPAGWEAAVMTEIDLAADENGHGYHAVLLNSLTASHGLTESTAFFLEVVSVLSAESGADDEAYFNAGLTWAVGPNWQVDGGLRTGLTAASTDFTPFLGLSAKF
jgi:Putative MetA-pathway of phenol degradation